ncbi:GNAT family N-acetyltransferase [Rubrimonas cliftonensis]|uniref:Ribosomal protein S18 acetylase RimI n=1 Tax=Rubrimonas cliftonensis TaxID=89524 RepID=A0A1H4A7E2_9RHOB|nr:GNAT family N-acetyltransferase [Rubrimonas cliftonensis]SEA31847.1 Ribosomal protein S18 acetylase RimI [Rubrimonas cliftonensis]
MTGEAAIAVRPARGADDIAAATRLAWEFVDFLNHRYPEMREEIAAYLKDQRFAEMLAEFPRWFNPPAGECMLATRDGLAIGIVMLKPSTAPAAGRACEMNRMFVTPSARRLGVGRVLCAALIAEAARLGYDEMRLSALDRHDEALPLYRSLGFAHDRHAPPSPAGARAIDMKLSLPSLAPSAPAP